MLKMNRGATRETDRSARVIDMDELKRARERRASSARHPQEEVRETRRAPAHRTQEEAEFRRFVEADDRPFWEVEEAKRAERPQARRVPRQEEPQERFAPAPTARRRPAEEERSAPRPGGRRPTRQDDRSPRPQERRPVDPRQERGNRTGLYMLLALVGLLAAAVMIGLSIFEIRTIDVKGNDTMTSESIVALAGISTGENIFKVNLGQVKRNLDSDPLLEVIGISRNFPDKITIEVRQRKPHGAIAYLGSYVIIDERGFVLDERADLPVGQYPLVTGIDIEPAEKGRKLTGVDDAKLKAMYALLSALYDNKAIEFISEASLQDPDNIKLLTGEGMVVDIGKSTDLGQKAKWIACTIPELRSQGYTTGVLYVTGTNSPVYSAAGSGDQQSEQVGEQTGEQNGEQSQGDNQGQGEGTEGQEEPTGEQGEGPDNAA